MASPTSVTLMTNTDVGVPNGAARQVSAQGFRLLLSVALPFLGPWRPPLGPPLADGTGEERMACGKVSWARRSATLHWPALSCVPSKWREAGQGRPARAPGGQF